MNPYSGELRELESLEHLQELQMQGFEEVPTELRPAAKKKLAGRKSAKVSLTSGGKLSRWAASKRKQNRGKAKATRRHNRSYHG